MSLRGVLPYTTNRYGKNFRHFLFTDESLTWVEALESPRGASLSNQIAAIETQWPDFGPGKTRVIPLNEIRRATFEPGPGYPRLNFIGDPWWNILADCTFMLSTFRVDEEKTSYARALVPKMLPNWVELKGF